MSKFKKACMIMLIGFSMLLVVPNLAMAAIETVATSADLQTKLDSAMLSRSTSYSINFTGLFVSQTAFASNISTIINNIDNADDYIKYSTKSIVYSYSNSPATGVTSITFKMAYWDSATQTDYVSTQVTQILSQIISSGMNDYQKEKVIHDWIVTKVAYDTALVQHSDYAALVSPYKTVCQGYALLTYKMLNQAGIQTKILEGTAGGEDHTWNEVYLDGAWYHLDTTWDDPIPDVAGRVMYDYYNLTDAQIKVNHTWSTSYPLATTSFDDTLASKISSDSSNAAIYQGISDALGLKYLTPSYTVNNRSELTTTLQQTIQNLQPEFKVRYMTGSTAATDLSAAINGFNNITSYSYSKTDFVRSAVLGDVLLDVQLKYNTPVGVNSVSVSQSTLTLAVGGTSGTLTATVLPTNASDKNIKWSSSDNSVVTVSGGIVKPIGIGTATITATTIDGGKTATSIVTVVPRVTGVKLSTTTATLKVGDPDLTLTATIVPTNASTQDVLWTSSKPSVATVSSSGVVHAIVSGTAIITATSKQDSTKLAKCTVTVPVLVTGVSTPATLTAKVGTTITLAAV
ncbi:MAG: Ig-like domain-containing protein, partial [Desulfosporosinus sp.]|nr:Ig-like domain-containing protein [Desulfosporosinus sp.]